MNAGREARRALRIFVATLIAAQPLSMLLGTSYLQRWGSPGNAYNQWTAYLSRPAPDVLVIGDSRVRLDVDASALSRAIGARVSTIGIDAVKPVFLEGLIERVVASPAGPREVVIALSEYQLNATWGADAASGGPQTNYFWQVSGPIDPSYLVTAIRDDEERGRLVAGWAVPLFANYAVIVGGVRCDLAALRRRTDCVDDYADRDRIMDAATLARWGPITRDGYLGRFSPATDQANAILRTAARLRDRGIAVRFLVLPVYRVEALAPDAYKAFVAVARDLALRAGTNLIDLHSRYDDRADLFFDPNHLTRAGSAQLVEQLRTSIGSGVP